MYLSWASTGRRNVPFLETKKRKKCHPGHYARAWIHATAIVEGGRDEVCNCLIACAWLHTATAIEGGREVACSRCHSGSSHRQSGLDPCRLGLDLHRRCRQWGEGRSPATTLSRGGGRSRCRGPAHSATARALVYAAAFIDGGGMEEARHYRIGEGGGPPQLDPRCHRSIHVTTAIGGSMHGGWLASIHTARTLHEAPLGRRLTARCGGLTQCPTVTEPPQK
jgi:hypothetical protein